MATLLQVDRNVWQLAFARRLSFLIDGEAYYRALAFAMARARYSIDLLGWDVHSRIRLLRGGEHDGLPSELGPRIAALLAKNSKLEVRILTWDFPVIFAHERETRIRWRTRWPRHPRFQLRFDCNHPAGASHHQKIVLIDECLAFIGGMDVARARWDTPEHRARDNRRSDPGSKDYPPSHDVHAVVDGDVPGVLSQLVRSRWKAVGVAISAAVPVEHDCWPAGLIPDITDVPVGISRTLPETEDVPPVREVETLHLDAIRAARSSILIENQYLTSEKVVTALGRRLQEEDGPEVVAILPRRNYGWLEDQTIEVLRHRAIARLRGLSRHGRLRICYPVVPDLGERQVNIHSKVLVVDDRLLRVGSSNLTNRSMALDTECDLVIEAGASERVREAIAGFRNRLLAEHLGIASAEVSRELAADPSLVRLVDRRASAEQGLREFPSDGMQHGILADHEIVDPKRPLTTEVLVEHFAPQDIRRGARGRLKWLLVSLIAVSALAVSWEFTPLRHWIEPEAIARMAERIRSAPAAPLIVVGTYLIAVLLAVPILALIFATVFLFGPWLGMMYSIAGCFAGALLTYGIGRAIGRGAVEQLAGPRMQRALQRLARRSVMTVIVVRLLPIAPFIVVNMVIGASNFRLRDFALGTLIGMMPGIVAIALLESRIEHAFRRPGLESIALLVLLTTLFAVALAWARKHLRTAH